MSRSDPSHPINSAEELAEHLVDVSVAGAGSTPRNDPFTVGQASMAKAYAGDPDKLLNVRVPRPSAPSVYVPVNVWFDGVPVIELKSSTPFLTLPCPSAVKLPPATTAPPELNPLNSNA